MAATDFVSLASSYPENLEEHVYWNCNLKQYGERLHNEKERLFGNDGSATVDILQLVNASQSMLVGAISGSLGLTTSGFVEKQVQNHTDLHNILIDYNTGTTIPRCQHFFIRGKSSQTKLFITEIMTKVLLTHFEVMPTFLDFLFTFGKQQTKKNFHFSGFRAKESWAEQSITQPQSLHLLSSRFQLCYNLRSVEPTPNPPEWPWSIRQAAVYHAFDLTSGNAVWINIKGSTDISPRIKRLQKPGAPSDGAFIRTASSSFRASLATHLAYCEWSSENWASYIGFLEDRLQDQTRYALLATVSRPQRSETPRSPVSRTMTEPGPKLPPRTLSWAQASRARLSRLKDLVNSARAHVNPRTDEQRMELAICENTTEVQTEHEDFTYDDLRKIQYIEDQANIALLVIRSNVNILQDLKGYYHDLQTSPEFVMTLSNECNTALQRFSTRITAIVNDSKLQQSRLETFLRLLGDRKSLLLQLFAHRNMSATKYLTERAQISAEKSQISAEKMENLTEHMRSIALKTEKETIFMRIITVVTLFFLPGTFVAVSQQLSIFEMVKNAKYPQTLMSTDIVKFQNNGILMQKFSWVALVVYLAVTVPIMVFTFWAASWYRRRVTRLTGQRRAEKDKADAEQRPLDDV